MPYKKKATPGSIQLNKLIDQLPEKREKIRSQIEFKNDALESQTRIDYKNELIDFKVVNNCQDWMPTQNQECKNYRRKQGNH